MPGADAHWRVAGHRNRVALAACIFWHRDGAARHPHCPGATGMDATVLQAYLGHKNIQAFT